MTYKNIYNQYKNLVFNLALQYCQNRQDAEEITQDVFVKIFDKWQTFRKDADLKTWIYRINEISHITPSNNHFTPNFFKDTIKFDP